MTQSLRVNQSKLLTDMAMCVDYYRQFTTGTMVCTHVPVQLDERTRLIAHLAVLVNYGEHKQCSQSPNDDCFIGPPNFILDIHTSDETYDERRGLFERAGVVEYVSMVEGEEAGPRALWNQLIDGQYLLVGTEDDGTIESLALPGLRIPMRALRDKNWLSILAAIQYGVSRKDHHDFMGTIWSG